MSATKTNQRVKIMTTYQVRSFNRRSVQAKQNRLLTNEFLRSLDDDGFHVIGFTMPHTNYEGTNGMRCKILCKVTEDDKPIEVWLDMSHEDYNSIKTIEVPAKPDSDV